MKIASKALAAGIVTVLMLAGCANNNSSSQPKKDTAKKSAVTAAQSSPYVGKANQKKLEQKANSEAKNASAHIEAAKSAFVNKDYKKSISYYKDAIKINPKDAIANNNLGNVYFRGLNKPKDAVQYYKKATQLDPKYSYGWWNLALAQQALGQKKDVQTTVAAALKHISKKDPNYKSILKMKK